MFVYVSGLQKYKYEGNFQSDSGHLLQLRKNYHQTIDRNFDEISAKLGRNFTEISNSNHFPNERKFIPGVKTSPKKIRNFAEFSTKFRRDFL